MRLKYFGRNSLPRTKQPGFITVFFRQFASPLIYVLVAAALLSAAVADLTDAAFITAVLLINAVIGTIQEYSAQQAAVALQHLVPTYCRVLRGGETYEVDAEQLVPGDILMLESGDKIPADIRLFDSHDLEIDESLLTGESDPVLKNPEVLLNSDSALCDRKNMVFAGSLVKRGRGVGAVVATALTTELGKIASAILDAPPTKAPLLIRMERFTNRIAITVCVASLIMAVTAFRQGMPVDEIFLLAVALAVSAIPEGLPIALTVALSIGLRRMAYRNVIIRRLVAVEALGSCTFIATDKTGTLTINQLTARRIVFPDLGALHITGEGMVPEGIIKIPENQADNYKPLLQRICQTAALANEGFLGLRNHKWIHQGDAVDIALLVMAHKAGIIKMELAAQFPETALIPFESERLFSASLNRTEVGDTAFVKGALEKLLPMCKTMASSKQCIKLNSLLIHEQAQQLASQGYRVLALASGKIELEPGEVFSENHLKGLTLLGLVGMIDPLRSEAKQAIARCRSAGIEVAMITGDHPATAFAIAAELGLADNPEQIVTGRQLVHATETENIDQLTRKARVFARVEPQQKLDIVHSLQRNGHFVAVSGDGANDAPALRAAQVGVAMGNSGTDVARETAELIITDDNFDSIVAGIEEGRVAYANVRKVIFLLISTGAAELVLFTLALFNGLPLPLLAVQLLWLNLITNGIQDVALAFEPAEGDELLKPPRPTSEYIFNRIMIERVVLSALVIGCAAFLLYQWLLNRGFSVDDARNGTLLLMVLFENFHAFNSRSETRSVFLHNPLKNPILLVGALVAQLIHIGAMYTPGVRDVLHIAPISLAHWLELLVVALSVLIAMELYKFARYIFTSRPPLPYPCA